MAWTQVWLPSATSTRLRLKLEEQTTICKAIESFARDAPDNQGRGHLLVGKWWVGISFQKDARYMDDAGEPAEGDVVWIHSLHVPPPGDVAEESFIFEDLGDN